MHGGSISLGEIKKMFSSQLDRVKVTEEIFVKLRNCIASNHSIKDWQHVHQFERDAIKVLLQQNPSESVESRACMLVDQIHERSGVKLTDEFDSYRLQSADTAPSSSSKGSSSQGDGMVTLSCNKTIIFPNHILCKFILF